MGLIRGYLNRIKLFYSHKINKVLLVVIAFSISILTLIYNFNLKASENVLVEQMLHREQIVTRSAAKSIEGFIELLGTQVSSYSTRTSIINNNSQTQELLDSFTDYYNKYPIGGISIFNEDGILIYTANKSGTKNIGVSIFDREYFTSLKNDFSQEFVVSSPLVSRFGGTEGRYVVIVASPIVNNNIFNGILSVSIDLSGLTDSYFEPLKLTDETIITLENTNNQLFYSSNGKSLGLDYSKFDYKDSNEWKNVIDNNLLIATSSIKPRNGTTWFLSVATPVDNAFVFLDPLSKTNFLFLIFGISIVIVFSMFLTTIVRILKKR